MSYTKQTWTTGDTITAEKLNHMEDGISEGGGSSGGENVVFVRATQNDSYTVWEFEKTLSEIMEMMQTGIVQVLEESNATTKTLIPGFVVGTTRTGLSSYRVDVAKLLNDNVPVRIEQYSASDADHKPSRDDMD